MKLIDKAKQAAMEGAVTKALEYLEKDPETNIPKLMELVDKFTPQDWYKGQRDAIRNAIQDTDSNWYKLIIEPVSAGSRCSKSIFPELYCKCQS